MNDYDLLIVGGGVVGCVIAEQAATLQGWRSLIVEKRSHIAGNCYDRYHPSGLMIHQYGPHYFRTNKAELIEYLSQFTEWVEGNYFVKSFSQGQYFSFPINLNTLEQFYNRSFTATEAAAHLESLRLDIPNPKNSEEFVLSRVGKDLYEAFYLGYTLKQWSKHPAELAASVCGRIPIRFNRDERYVDHKFQLTPAHGFTAMFSKMIQKPEIHTLLNANFQHVKQSIKPRIATIYTGPVDEYFDFQCGHLPWRSLEFDFKVLNKDYEQPCVQINYPNDFEYTRSVEIKHVTRQIHPNTVISYEYPRASGDPYYPIPSVENETMYLKYKKLCEHETKTNHVYFAGRLATYRYINTDEAIEEALNTFQMISKEHARD